MFFEKSQQEQIARTGFLASLLSYGLFWGLDIVRPGFVARFFSVHIFLFSSIVFGVWWGFIMEEYQDHVWIQRVMMGLFGVGLGVVTWSFGEVFGLWRPIISVVAFLTPSLIWWMIRYR